MTNDCAHCWHEKVVTIYLNAVVRELCCCHCGVVCTKVNGDEHMHGPHLVCEPDTLCVNADLE